MKNLVTFSANDTHVVQDVPKRFTVAVSGTFGSGTVAVKYNTGSGTYATYASGETGSFTAAGEREFCRCGLNDDIQIVLTGSTSPALTVIIRELEA